jgi:hypothetical protein
MADGSPDAATCLIVTMAFGLVLLVGSAALATQKSSRSAA